VITWLSRCRISSDCQAWLRPLAICLSWAGVPNRLGQRGERESTGEHIFLIELIPLPPTH
jgi:hypothetical protein